jgi:anti-sigma B factor antagonist
VAQPFGIAASSAYGRTVIAVSGELDFSSVDQLRGALAGALSGPDTHVSVDMSEVTFIDSSGLGCLIGAYNKLGTEGRVLTVVNPSRPVERLLRATGQLDRFTDAAGSR